MRGLQGQIKALEQKIGTLQVTRICKGDGGRQRRVEVDAMLHDGQEGHVREQSSLEEYQAGTERVERFMKNAAEG